MKSKRTRILLFSLLVGTTLVAPPSARQETAAAVSASKAVELPAAKKLIERYFELTNAKALGQTKSKRLAGKIEIVGMGIEGKFESLSASPSLSRTKMDLGAMGETLQGYDGKVAWMVNPMMGASLMEGKELLPLRVEGTYDKVGALHELYESMKTVGRETFEGKDCYKVETVMRPLEGMDAEATKKVRTGYEFYDAETGLMAGSMMTAASPMGDIEVTVVNTKYETFGDYLIPTKTLQKMPGANMAITIESLEIDTVDPSVFALPAAIQALLEVEPAKAQ